ncbi:hypothetical protein LTR28_007985 [Elasticomyces elasticus]|nr:hypothetical protein LTR28_007985 [Elasticomyces elasticus]
MGGATGGATGGTYPSSSARQQSTMTSATGGLPSSSARQQSMMTSATSGLPSSSARQQSTMTSATGGYSDPTSQHHPGRDAALAGGAGAAGLGAHEAGRNRDTDPSSRSSNLTNTADSRVRSVAEEIKGHSTAGPHSSGMMNKADPRVDSDLSKQEDSYRHPGRDAALAGGVGAAGLGAYEANKRHGRDDGIVTDHHTGLPMNVGKYGDGRGGTDGSSTVQGSHQQPLSSNAPSDPSDERHHGRDAALAGGAGAAGLGAYEASKHRDPADTSRTSAGYDRATQPATTGAHGGSATGAQDQQHHYGRDAALAGGAGAVGVGAYEASKHRDPTDTSRTGAGYNQATQPARTGANVDSATSAQDQQHHYGRDAAVVGGTGAAAYGAKHEYDEHEAKRLEKERIKENERLEKERIKENERLEKERIKENERLEKERAKVAEKAHKQHEKELAKEEKHHEKELAKEEKQHEKEHAKEEKHHEKEKKKHGGLFGFLHKDKDKTEEEPTKTAYTADEAAHPSAAKAADLQAHERHRRELEAAAAAGTVGVAGAEFERERHDPTDTTGHHERNRLHKDPPPGYGQTAAGATAGHHVGTDQNKVSGLPQQANPDAGIVIEPHTGLPMNVGKYGSGHGGVDGSRTVEGYHEHAHEHGSSRNASVGTAMPAPDHKGHLRPGEKGAVGPDWEKINKANTPY